MITTETEQLSGISSGGPALSGGSMAKDDTSSMQMTMSQQRMAATVRNVSNLLSKMFGNWLTMSEAFLSNEQIDELFSAQEATDYFIFKDSNQTRVSIKVGTDVNRMVKMQQLNMLLQQSKQLGQSVPPETFNYLVAEMFELFDMYEKATELREFKPQPSPEQIKAQQLELQAKELDNQKKQVDIQATVAKMQADGMKAKKDLIDAQSSAQYKTAQTAEKYAKAEATKIDSALKPAEFVQNAMEQNQPKEDRRTI